MTTLDIDALKAWIGRQETQDDVITAAAAAGLAAALDHPEAPSPGQPLPPLWHWIYFTPRARQSDVGPDGHPRLGGFLPPIPLPRRMWAGGRLRFEDPLRVGDEVRRQTEIVRIVDKTGQQGPLIFLTLKHTLTTARGLAIEEEQDLVYRAPGAPNTPGLKSPVASGRAAGGKGRDEPAAQVRPALWYETLAPDPVLLFRYSALTFNAHRIHYDLPYAQEQEGYRDLVVQGPLTATLLADRLMARAKGRLREFAFRGQQPLFSGEAALLCGAKADETGGYDLWAETPQGAAAMSASARLETGHAD